MTEQNSGSQFVQLAITGTTAWSAGESVSYSTRDGTATVADGDYVPHSGTVVCPSYGDSCDVLFVEIEVNGDFAIESDEVFYLDAGGKTGTITILNNDVPNPVITELSVSPSPSNEGRSVTATAEFLDVDTVDDHTCTVNYGDGSETQPGTVSGTTCTGPAHTYLDDDPTGTPSDGYNVTVIVTDGDGNTGSSSIVHTVRSVAPSVDTPIVSPVTSNEGESVTASATFSDAGTLDTHTCTVDYGDGTGPVAGTIEGNTCTGPSHLYTDDDPVGTASDDYTITVRVTDDDTVTGSGSTTHTVNNLAPTVSTPTVNPSPSDEGQSVIASATFSDPGVDDTHTCTVDYGDGTGPLAGTVAGNTCTGPAHIYLDDDPSGTASDTYTVTVTVTDDDTGSHQATASHNVNNLAPTITGATNDGPVAEGSPATITVIVTDPGVNDTHTFFFDCDDNGSYETAGSGNQGQCVFGDNGPFTVGLQVVDDDGGEHTSSTTVTVTNVDPNIDSLSVDHSPSDEGQSVVASATFSDPGTDDTHTCTVDYGDGTGPLAGTVAGNTCTGPAHIYLDDDPSGTASDAYTVTVTVTDDDTGFDSDSISQTVNNVAPMITAITTNGPVSQGQPVTISVTIFDAGAADTHDYAFDCDKDGSYETSGTGNQGECDLDPSAAKSTIGVQVIDDDLGVVTDTVEAGQTLTICVNYATGAIGVEGATGCSPGTVAAKVPGLVPMTICINSWTGQLLWSRTGHCGTTLRPHLLPGSGPLYFCKHAWTGQLRVTLIPGQCYSHEITGVIPG